MIYELIHNKNDKKNESISCWLYYCVLISASILLRDIAGKSLIIINMAVLFSGLYIASRFLGKYVLNNEDGAVGAFFVLYLIVYILIPIYKRSTFLLSENSINVNYLFYAIMSMFGLIALCRWKDIEKRKWWEYFGIIAAFVIIWNDTLFTNYSTSLLDGIVISILLFIWTSFFYDGLKYFFSKVIQSNSNRIEKKWIKDEDKTKIWLIIFGIMLIVGMTMGVVYYPGLISPDCMIQWKDSHYISSIEYRKDDMSFIYTCFYALFTHFTDSFFPITLICVVIFSFIWASLMTFLWEKGVPSKVIFISTLIWILIPINLIYMACSWKDIPYSLCITSFGISLFQLFSEKKISAINMVWFVLLSSLTALLRSSGIIVVSISLLIFVIVRYKEDQKWSRDIILAVVSCIVILGIKFPLFSFLSVNRGDEGFAATPFIDGVWENVYQEKELPTDVYEYIKSIVPVDDFKDGYVEAYTNVWIFPGGYSHLDFSDSVKAYLRCLKTHPWTTFMARLKRTYNLWALFPNTRFLVNTNVNYSIEYFSEPYGWQYLPQFAFIRNYLYKAIAGITLFDLTALIINRAGFSLLIIIALLPIQIRKKNTKTLFVIIPAILNHITLLVGCCYPDYRYSYPIFMTTYIYIIYVLFNNSTRNRTLTIEK